MSHPDHPPAYPAIRLMTTFGSLIAIILAAVPPALGIWAVISSGPWFLAIIGSVAGLFLWLIVQSFVEVLRILSDTLMPR